MFNNVTFAYPLVLYFLGIIPILVFYYIKYGRKRENTVIFSSLKTFKGIPPGWRERLRHLPFILRMAALALFIIALARPQSFSSGENIYSEGIDIAMVLDISSSMLAEDFSPNRLEASKNVIKSFIADRHSDRIGLVIFSREAFTQCPLTIDYNVLNELLREVKSGMIEDGTAIGNAIANGVNRLKDSEAKSKIIILVTDGVNNAGEVNPLSAAEIAKTFGIRIYTIGVGTLGEAPYPVKTAFGTRYQMVPVEIDENLLKKVAAETNGKYYRAVNNRKLQEIYTEIDQLERTKVEVTTYRNAKELFFSWLGTGFLLLLFEIGVAKTVLRRIP
jgi:Ca-activated chloride channel homolog